MTSIDKLISLYETHDGWGNGWMTLEEASFLHHTIRMAKCTEYYECGTCDGWSTLWAATALAHTKKVFFPDRELKVHTWDIVARRRMEDEGFDEKPLINRHIGPFHLGVSPVLKQRDTGAFAAILIDGNHGTEAVKNDFKAIEPHLRVNDIVFFHDTRRAKYDGSTRFVENLACPKYQVINLPHSRNGFAVLRKAHKN